MVEGVRSYLSCNDDGNACIPLTEDKFIPKISSIQWSVEPPESFPLMHPFGSLLSLMLKTTFSPKSAKKRWSSYLEECGEWYRSNKLTVDVLYLVLRDKKEEGDEDIEIQSPNELEIVKTHLWTFCRELDGEWKIIAMDH
uniref:Uncharacterized protein n=1 Tax=Eutreptiella gymnastica TaxID=73025 RepID=A0A7S1NF45_9EUGL